MQTIGFSVAITLSVLIISIVASSNGEVEVLETTNIERKNASHSLDSLIQQELNCTEKDDSQLKSRRKRYVAFPEGSSFSIAFCATVGFVGNPQFIYFSWAINYGYLSIRCQFQFGCHKILKHSLY